MCVPFGDDRRMMTEAINEKDAQPGDLVRIEMSPKSTISAAFLLYLLPVVALFLGYALGASATGEEKYGIVAALVMLALSFAFLRVLNSFFPEAGNLNPSSLRSYGDAAQRMRIIQRNFARSKISRF